MDPDLAHRLKMRSSVYLFKIGFCNNLSRADINID